MHFQRCYINQMPGSGKFFLEVVLTQDMTNILAKKAFDTFTELLNTINISLVHSPGSIGRIRGPRLKPFYFLFDLKVYRYIGHKVFDHGKCFHRLNGNWLTFG